MTSGDVESDTVKLAVLAVHFKLKTEHHFVVSNTEVKSVMLRNTLGVGDMIA